MHTDFGFSQIPLCEGNLFEFHENNFKNKTIVFIHKQNCVYTQKKIQKFLRTINVADNIQLTSKYNTYCLQCPCNKFMKTLSRGQD